MDGAADAAVPDGASGTSTANASNETRERRTVTSANPDKGVQIHGAHHRYVIVGPPPHHRRFEPTHTGVTARRTGGSSHGPAPLEGPAQGDLVGVLQVAADR
ncbi:hypothetical protein CLV64_11341 [Micromonospora phaseoli]|nr:hypothetical protein CLV64_11341 [Micromonospora phaseoli]GIJ78106.1 hypothetical protein Xph01_25380 [Micromonospora phaseoli]